MRNECRINARLDKALARKVSLVRKRTRRSLSQVVQESLARYCDEALSEGGEPLSILKSAGFVGCADGPEDLSSGYKKDLTRSLGRKA
jgi:inactivated superfamily I helicase